MKLSHKLIKALAAVHLAMIGFFPYLFWMIQEKDWSLGKWSPFFVFELSALALLLIKNKTV